MYLSADVLCVIMHLCDIHTQMVCQHRAVLETDEEGQYDAVQRVIDEEDTITLRCLCKWASSDIRLCRLLSIHMCYSIDSNNLNSFRCLLLHLPRLYYPMFYEFGANTVGVWALMHSARRFRPHHMHLLLQKFSFTSFELAIADKVGKYHKQGWVSTILEHFSSRCVTPMHAHNVCPYRSTPFTFKRLQSAEQ